MTAGLDERRRQSAIADALERLDDPLLARSILGTEDPALILSSVNDFCIASLGSGLDECFFFEMSVGAAMGLRLRDGRKVFLKAHPPERSLDFLRAACRVQHHLSRKGFPCPKPLAEPKRFGDGSATVEEFVDAGERADAHDPRIRRTMARALARQIRLSADAPCSRGLARGWTWPEDSLWPSPHNALFDFGATSRGAEWIDRIAEEAKAVVDGSPRDVVIGHADWSVDHFRFEDGAIRAVYDWDSLRLDRETVIVGTAAATFTSQWRFGIPDPPSPGETRLFVDDYEAARGRTFSGPDREAVAAAAAYVMAYGARCEHAIDIEGQNLAGSFREALSLHGVEYRVP